MEASIAAIVDALLCLAWRKFSVEFLLSYVWAVFDVYLEYLFDVYLGYLFFIF